MNKTNLKKKIYNLLLFFLLILTIFFNSIYLNVNAFVLKEKLQYIEKEEKILNYVYEDNTINTTLETLIDRTIQLEEKYSSNEAKSILKELKSLIPKITSKDINNNEQIKKDNPETNKLSPFIWIEINVLKCCVNNEPNNLELFKNITDEIYNICVLECQKNFLESYNTVHLSIGEIDNFSNKEEKSYVSYIFYKFDTIGNEFLNNHMKPSKIVPSKDYDDYLREMQESTETTIDTGENIETTPRNNTNANRESIKPNNATNTKVNNFVTTENYNKENLSNYLNAMNNLNTNETKEDTQELHIFYTLDKTMKKPKWIDSRITVKEKDKIMFKDVLSVLNIIAKHLDNSFLIEDKDMIMFIAEGKPLILNYQKFMKQETINKLFDNYEKVGLKIMLKANDSLEVSDSLISRIENKELNRIMVDNEEYILQNTPILEDDRVLLPLVEVSKILGYKVSIDNNNILLTYKMSENKDSNENITIKMTIGSNLYIINDVKNTLHSVVIKKDDIIYCEFDKIVTEINYQYYYDAESGKLIFE